MNKPKDQNTQVNMLSVVTDSDQREYLFDLEPFFASDTMDFTDKRYFPKENTSSVIEQKPYANYHEFNNPFMENEVKGFIRHMVVDNHNMPSYVNDFIIQFAQAWSKFVNSNHPELNSCVDIDYEDLYKEYLTWLKDNGIQAISYSKRAQVTKYMEWLYFPIKTNYVAGFNAYYKYINSIVYPDTRNEKDKDVWDVRNLGIPFSTLPSRPRYTVNYEPVTQLWLRDIVKNYNFFRIQHREMATVLDDMKAFRLFSAFLREKHPEISSLKEITRDVVVDYIAYVRAQNYVASTFNRRLSAIRTFLTVGNMLDMGDFPTKPVFSDSDYRKVNHKLPVPFSDNELRQMNAHIADLPLVYGRIFFVLQDCGMRMSDLCCTTIEVDGRSCLTEQSDGNYILTYAQPKVHRTNSIPVSDLAAEVIKSAIDDSKEAYGDDCKYIFAKSATEPVGEEDFVQNMNKLSKRHDMRTDLGKPLRIKGHTFRRTKATEYANKGIGLDVIRIMLGQKKIGVLKHYITIHSSTMVDVMKNIIEEDEQLIRNIGNVQATVIKESTAEVLLPLPNGYCGRSAVQEQCGSANACYFCRIFKPAKEFLPIYRRQLLEAENNIHVAEANGYERILQINTDLRDKLKEIIAAVKGEADG